LKDFRLGTGAALAVAAACLVLAPPALASGGPGLGEARAAAREAVRAHHSYRIIRSSHPLRVRACWRPARRVVRCSLYRTAPTPCALDGKTGICVQVIARRVWRADVRLRRGRAVARIVQVSDTTSETEPAR